MAGGDKKRFITKDTRFWILDAGYSMLDTGYQMLDIGFQVPDPGFQIQDDEAHWIFVIVRVIRKSVIVIYSHS